VAGDEQAVAGAGRLERRRAQPGAKEERQPLEPRERRVEGGGRGEGLFKK
jgi:hypothetical protein